MTKLKADGSALVYSTYFGGSLGDIGTGIAVDSSDTAYVTGFTDSQDFPTLNPLQTTCASFTTGQNCPFVASLSPTGNALIYSTYLGGSSQGRSYGIAVDSSSNAYIAGGTNATDFPTKNPVQAGNAGDHDVIIAKISTPPDFLLGLASGSSSSATVTAGGTATYTLALSPIAGFNQTVNLTCSGAPATINCTPSPTSVILDGTNAGTVTVTVTTARARSAFSITGDSPKPSIAWLPSLYVAALVIVSLIFNRPQSVRPVYSRSRSHTTKLDRLTVSFGGTGSRIVHCVRQWRLQHIRHTSGHIHIDRDRNRYSENAQFES